MVDTSLNHAFPAGGITVGEAVEDWTGDARFFEYRNTDAVPHHVSVTVQYQDAFRASRGQFGAKVTLAPTGKDTGTPGRTRGL